MLGSVTSLKNENLTYILLLDAGMKKYNCQCIHKVTKSMVYVIISSWNIAFVISSWLVE